MINLIISPIWQKRLQPKKKKKELTKNDESYLDLSPLYLLRCQQQLISKASQRGWVQNKESAIELWIRPNAPYHKLLILIYEKWETD